MAIRIVDFKPLDMTEEEYTLYQSIVNSYNTHTNKGSDLFRDLFQTDDRGIITLLVPPTKQRTTLEVFLFLMTVSQNQHLRLMHEQVDDIVRQFKAKMAEVDKKLAELKGK
jgi:hypothetical protein